MKIAKLLSTLILAPFALVFPLVLSAETVKRPNVVMIAVDDMRPETGAYGAAYMRTPNLDRLAAEGVRFERAYTSQAVCLPSRVSLLTGMRPDTTGIHDIYTKFRKAMPEAVTIVQHFRAAGYYTVGLGKIYHDEQPAEWNKWITVRDAKDYVSDEAQAIIAASSKKADEMGMTKDRWRVVKGPAWEIVPDGGEAVLHDTLITDRAVAEITKAGDQPFFLAVGYKRPHLPFVAPERFWKMYPEGETTLPANYRMGAPTAPAIALTNWSELRGYPGMPASGPLQDAEAVRLLRGYRASISYVDHEIGRLLAALRASGRDRDTIVVLWGDHGFKTGEHGMWVKHTNFEIDARVSLIVSAPGRARAGLVSTAPVELVDVFPMLCDLTGLPIPAQVRGESLVPLLADQKTTGWRGYARSQYLRDRKTGGNIIGYSIRTENHRYTEWRNQDTDALVAAELYDHLIDPAEDRNLAKEQTTETLRGELSLALAKSRQSDRRL